MSPTSFRQAEVADADVIAVLHVASWRETYSGILPDQFLDELSVEVRSAMWRGVLGDRTNVFVAENGNDIVGFGACGRQRNEALREQGFDGEIGALYVLKPQQRSG
jgi:acetyltransferase (GNAT) family protein